MPTFAAPDLQRMTEEVFHTAGFPCSAAQTIADIMVRANLAGHDAHGVMHIPGYVGRVRSGQIRPGAPVESVYRVTRRISMPVVCNCLWGPIKAARATV